MKRQKLTFRYPIVGTSTKQNIEDRESYGQRVHTGGNTKLCLNILGNSPKIALTWD